MLQLDTLREGIRGTVTGPDDDGYDDARQVRNGMIDKRPAVIVQPVNAGDVMTAVRFAADNDMTVAVRGGGHSVPGFGTCDGGVVVDLSAMRGVRVDPLTQTARVSGGATWGDLNSAAYPFGLATTGGIISTTGVGGLTLGGGIGYLARGLGLALDNLLSADVVTGDGTFHVASDKDDADLFWAIRGGGGNFGVVTSFEFRLSPVKDIYGGPMFYELDKAGDLFRLYREFIADAPEQFGGFPAYQIAPPLPFIPEDRHGEPLALMVTCWSGDLDQGEKMLKPFRDLAPVVAEMVGPMPYPALNSAFDALYPSGLRHYWKANFVKELTDDAITAHLEHGSKVPELTTTMHIYPINGACHRVAPESTAFAYRDANFATVIAGMWPDAKDDERNTTWVREYYEATAPHSEEGGYINFMAEDDQGRIRANYKENYDRLAADQDDVRPGEPVPAQPEHRAGVGRPAWHQRPGDTRERVVRRRSLVPDVAARGRGRPPGARDPRLGVAGRPVGRLAGDGRAGVAAPRCLRGVERLGAADDREAPDRAAARRGDHDRDRPRALRLVAQPAVRRPARRFSRGGAPGSIRVGAGGAPSGVGAAAMGCGRARGAVPHRQVRVDLHRVRRPRAPLALAARPQRTDAQSRVQSLHNQIPRGAPSTHRTRSPPTLVVPHTGNIPAARSQPPRTSRSAGSGAAFPRR